MLFESIQTYVNAHITRLVFTLIHSRHAQDYSDHCDAYEDSCAARIGLLHLDSAHCFVLDHADASIGMQLPTPWGKLHLGYAASEGEDNIRPSGWYVRMEKRPFPFKRGNVQTDSSQDFPF